jgi:AcrR family transcriptional regulator
MQTGSLATSLRPATAVVAVPAELAQVSPDVRSDAAWFWWVFLETDDLAELTPAARRMLAVAAALFLRRGAVATSVRDVARAAGVSPGALYNHFESKEDVLYHLVRFGNDRLVRSLDTAIPDAGMPRVRLAAFVTTWVTGHLGHQSLAQLVRREYIHLTGDRLAQVVAQRRAVRDRLVAIVRDGAEDGSFRLPGHRPDTSSAGPRPDDEADPTPVAVMVLDLCLAISDWYDPSRGPDASLLADLYVTAALRLLGADDVPAPEPAPEPAAGTTLAVISRLSSPDPVPARLSRGRG